MFNYLEISGIILKLVVMYFFVFQIVKQVPVRFDVKTLHIPTYSGMHLLKLLKC